MAFVGLTPCDVGGLDRSLLVCVRRGGVKVGWGRTSFRRCGVVVSASVTSSSAAAKSTLDKFLKIQNGSDVRGVALDVIPEEPVTVTNEYATTIAAAFARFVAEKRGKDVSEVRIALSRDSRLSGPALLSAAAMGVASTGASATDCGLGTTPAMFMATILGETPFDGAIELTASHLPLNRNGLKFFTKEGGSSKTDVKQILVNAAKEFDVNGGKVPQVKASEEDFMAIYAAHLVNLIRKGCNHPEHYNTPLKGFKILVDAGNGAGGFFVDRVLNVLGADTTGSQFLDPDGTFPNHIPNPEDATAMQMASDAVLRNGADLGIVFDTDADRSAVVDSQGNGINRNRLIAVLASIVLKEHPGSTIVTDSVTSSGLTTFIQSKGGVHLRYKRGYKNVIDKGIELNAAGEESQLAIETSGHGAMKENYMLDDGAYLAVKIIIEMVKLKTAKEERGIAALYDGLKEPVEDAEFRLKFKNPDLDFKTYGSKVLSDLAEYGVTVDKWELEKVNYEGYRFQVDEGDGKKGWFLLRQSLHDPLLVLNIETEVSGGMKDILNDLLPFLERYDEIDLTSMKKI